MNHSGDVYSVDPAMSSVDSPAAAVQDMRRVLNIVAFIWTCIWLIALYYLVLSPSHREFADQYFQSFQPPIGGVTSLTTLAFVITFLGVHVLRFHEEFYDRFIVKWRERHDSDFILAKLFHPFATRLRPHYQQVLREKSATLLDQVFCPFLRGKGQQIEPRLIERFYRALTWYWITQLTEIALITWFIGLSAYGILGWSAGYLSAEWQGHLFLVLIATVILGAANALFAVRFTRKIVRWRADEEIDSINLHYPERLESLVIGAAARFGLLRQETEAGSSAEPPPPGSSPGVPGLWDHAFVTSPMASLQPAEYAADRALVVRLVEKLREIGFRDVFYPGEKRPEQSNFNDSYLALTSELRQIRRSGAFVLHWPASVPSSALFQLGYALALEKRILILLRNHSDLPYLVRAVSQLDKVSECTYRDEAHLISLVEQNKEDLF